MGHKIHPIGFRVGKHRKWTNNWLFFGNNYKIIFSYQLQVEKLLKCFFYFYRYTKINATKKLLLVDARIFKYGPRQIFLFVFFYKMVSIRNKNMTLRLKGKQNHKYFNSNFKQNIQNKYLNFNFSKNV